MIMKKFMFIAGLFMLLFGSICCVTANCPGVAVELRKVILNELDSIRRLYSNTKGSVANRAFSCV